MSGYEEEHNIQREQQQQDSSRHRPDLTTFFSNLESIDTSTTSNRHTAPLPSEISALFRQLANNYQIQLGETEGFTPADGAGVLAPPTADQQQLLPEMVAALMQGADDPPSRLQGMPESYFDEIERVPKKALKHDDSCPICAIPFLDDKYPLVVQLPCNKNHIFDMECIRPWLKLKTTCPMCRTDLAKKKEPLPAPVEEDEDDGEWDDMYA